MIKNELIERYKKVLMECNKQTNLISRKIKIPQLDQLLKETIKLNGLIKEKTIIDAGSGNGILGIPIAILNKEKKIILVENRTKKVQFLEKVKEMFEMENLMIEKRLVLKMLKTKEYKDYTLMARGFPEIETIIQSLKNRLIKKCFIITSANKIKKLKKSMEIMRKKIYNIESRDELKILVLENVSRETKKKV